MKPFKFLRTKQGMEYYNRPINPNYYGEIRVNNFAEYFPVTHFELGGDLQHDGRLSFYQIPGQDNDGTHYLHAIPFIWEPRDVINREYGTTTFNGLIKDFQSWYQNKVEECRQPFTNYFLPTYPRIRRFGFAMIPGTVTWLGYDREPHRFMNPRFINQNEPVRIIVKLYRR